MKERVFFVCCSPTVRSAVENSEFFLATVLVYVPFQSSSEALQHVDVDG
jgi:hypothetical protein